MDTINDETITELSHTPSKRRRNGLPTSLMTTMMSSGVMTTRTRTMKRREQTKKEEMMRETTMNNPKTPTQRTNYVRYRGDELSVSPKSA